MEQINLVILSLIATVLAKCTNISSRVCCWPKRSDLLCWEHWKQTLESHLLLLLILDNYSIIKHYSICVLGQRTLRSNRISKRTNKNYTYVHTRTHMYASVNGFACSAMAKLIFGNISTVQHISHQNKIAGAKGKTGFLECWVVCWRVFIIESAWCLSLWNVVCVV